MSTQKLNFLFYILLLLPDSFFFTLNPFRIRLADFNLFFVHSSGFLIRFFFDTI